MTPDQFISKLYREASDVSLADFPTWALDTLRQVIPFDGAIWGTGHISSQQFHTQTSVDVSTDIFSKLLEYVDINPIFSKLLDNQGNAVDMSEVFKDEDFYHSNLYLECFKPFDIERILSSIHSDERSGIFTLLTLYRFDREHRFTKREKQIQNRLLFHLLSAFSHRQLVTLSEKDNSQGSTSQNALCDHQGQYHSVSSAFLDILEVHLPSVHQKKFPLPINKKQAEFIEGNLHFSLIFLGDLVKISVRVKNLLDNLTMREKQIVEEVCFGSTFKQIARKLALSPSTVSNHLYRIYIKLGINTRSELIALANKNH